MFRAGCVALSVALVTGAVIVPAQAATAAPVVTLVHPNTGPLTGGARITISGSGFVHVSRVLFGTTPASGIRVASSTSMSLVVPRRPAGTVDVRVTVSTTSGSLTSAVRGPDRYAYLAPPAITSVAPVSVPTSGGTQVAIRGTNFLGVTKVLVGTVAARVTSVSPTAVTVLAPAHAAGAADVRVVGAYGTSAVTTADRLTYAVPSTTTVSNLTATQQGADEVALSWTNPTDPRFDQVVVRRTEGRTPPAATSDGAAVATVAAPGTSVVDTHRAPGATYSYAVFARVGGTYTAPASATVTVADWVAATLPDDNPSLGGAELDDISCSAPGTCVAVGWTRSSSAPGDLYEYRSPLVATMTGGVWTSTVPDLPSGVTSGQLEKLSCVDADHCTALGTTYPYGAGRTTLVETMIDGRWSPSAFGPAYRPWTLHDLVCTTATDCTALVTESRPDPDNANGTIDTPVAYHLTGGAWQRTDLPTPADLPAGTRFVLHALQCTGTDSCTAVGWASPASGSLPVVETLSGGTWTGRSLARPTGTTFARLQGFLCTATPCSLTAEAGTDTAHPQVYVYQFSGDGYTAVASAPLPDDTTVQVDTLVCPSASSCRAIGDTGVVHDEVLTYDSRGWTPSGALGTTRTPGHDIEADLHALACVSDSDCTIAGAETTDQGAATALVEHAAGDTWTPTAILGHNAESGLRSVSCPRPGTCTALGSFENADYTVTPYLETLRAGTWTRSAFPASPISGGTAVVTGVDALDCSSATFCAAVGRGYFVGPYDPGYLADVRAADGSWTVTRLPDPVTDVSCPADGHCTAVGVSDGDFSTSRPDIETFADGQWTRITLPVAAGDSYSRLTAVDCADATHCTAVGSVVRSGDLHTLVATLADGTWTMSELPTVADAASGTTSLVDVSCPAADACSVLGHYLTRREDDQTYLEHAFVARASGSTWTITALGDVGDAVPLQADDRRTGLSCATATACTVVSTYRDSAGVDSVVVHELHGEQWTTRPLTTVPGGRTAVADDVSCPTPTACVVVGSVRTGPAALPLVLTRG